MDNPPISNVSIETSDINVQKSKRSTFEITKVTSTAVLNQQNSVDEKSDSNNGVNLATDEQTGSIIDHSRPSSEETMYSPREGSPVFSNKLMPPPLLVDPHQRDNDPQSRFRLVKIQTNEPIHKGRWTCHYYQVPDISPKSTADNLSGNQGIDRCDNDSQSLHNVDNVFTLNSEHESQCAVTLLPEDLQQQIQEGEDAVDGQSMPRLLNSNMRPKFDLEDGGIGSQLLDMQGFSANSSFSENGGASAAAIDSKIAQAMDLVKSHLMFAVHEEIELLKMQIKELMDRNHHLELENNILRSAAPPDTLARLKELPPTPPHS